MPVAWTPHRFAGGLLVLDTANTVVLRDDPDRRFDRFDDPGEIARFADAANVYRGDELGGRSLEVRDPSAIARTVIDLRESADRLFRGAARTGELAFPDLSVLLAACARATAEKQGVCWPTGDKAMVAGAPVPFEAALSWSALQLLAGDTRSRIRICANCGWLFLDRSRNRSRIWCDMAVCGNRRKAARHYRRRRSNGDETDA